MTRIFSRLISVLEWWSMLLLVLMVVIGFFGRFLPLRLRLVSRLVR